MPLRLKRTLKVIGFNLALFLGLLMGMEVLCRWLQVPYSSEFTPTENAIARFDPELGWSYLPNLATTVRFGEKTRTVCFDDRGIRVPDPGFRLDDSQPSVLFIGGSFTMGHGLDYEQTFPAMLAADPRFSMQVVNLGVQAYGTDQSLLALRRHIDRFNTRVVVYTFINMHIYRNGNYDRRMLYPRAHFLGTKPLFGLDDRRELVLKKKPLKYADYHHSWLWDACKLLHQDKMGGSPPYPVALTHVLIREIKTLCDKKSARFILLHWRISPHEPKQTLQGAGVPVIDLLDHIPGLENLRIPGDAHPNARAHAAVARVLGATIATSQGA